MYSARTFVFNGKRDCLSPQKTKVTASSEFSKVTVVVGVMPFKSDTSPLLTVVTVPVMLAVPPGLETNPTKDKPPQLTTGMQAAHN